MDDNRRLMDRELGQLLSDAYMQSPDAEGYSGATERLSKLYKIRSDEVLAEKELALKKKQAAEEQALKERQADEARTQGWIRTAIEAAAVGLPAGIYVYGMLKGFKFEETGTITSQTLRNHFQKFRLFK